MDIAELLASGRIVCDANISSKKRALELVAGLLADVHPELSETEIFNGLLARERLGSTGIGHGIAIPHGRFKHVEDAVGAVVRFQNPVDYDAIDGQPVDFIFALLVPEDSTEAHLQLLGSLAELFSKAEVRDSLRKAADAAEIESILHHYWVASPGTRQAAS